MPLINGMKMACEPCIRGHRSTKCTHASERLMVPVRKPGRPLSSCPHPASRPCSCSVVTAAIPKKQKCGCGSSSGSTTEKEKGNSSATPPSPTAKGAAASHRVQKPASKNGPQRRPTIDVSALQRMDASQLNIMPPLDSQQNPAHEPNGGLPSMPGILNYSPLGFIQPNNSLNSNPNNASPYPQHISSPMLSPRSSKTTTKDGHFPPPINGMTNGIVNGKTNGSTKSTSGSCCGGGQAAQEQINGGHDPNANDATKNQPKSCCSGTDKPEIKQQPDLILTPQMPPQAPPINGMIMPSFQPPVPMPNGMFPYYPQPSVFAYPPQYGSYLQPLQPDQWRQLMMTIGVGHPTPGIPYNVAPDAQFSQSATIDGSSWTSHHCSCGDSCQCVGCATHPYNEATQSYVKSAWSTMLEDTQKTHNGTNGKQSHANGNHSNGRTTPVRTKSEGAGSPSGERTPSDTASGLGDEQIYSANDYLFVSYPFGESCEGEMASCPCGDDCQCIGCAIHSNGLAESSQDIGL